MKGEQRGVSHQPLRPSETPFPWRGWGDTSVRTLPSGPCLSFYDFLCWKPLSLGHLWLRNGSSTKFYGFHWSRTTEKAIARRERRPAAEIFRNTPRHLLQGQCKKTRKTRLSPGFGKNYALISIINITEKRKVSSRGRAESEPYILLLLLLLLSVIRFPCIPSTLCLFWHFYHHQSCSPFCISLIFLPASSPLT